MKINRNDPVRRRRSPFSILLILVVVVVLGVLAASWTRGGGQAQHRIEIAIPAAQLGH